MIRLRRLATLFCIVVFAFSLAFAYYATYAETVVDGKRFYFLVEKAQDVQVGTITSAWKGGAGYALSLGRETFVAHAVYLREEDALTAQEKVNANRKTGEKAIVLEKSTSTLTFCTADEKRRKETVVNAFSALYGCLTVLENTAKRLDDGATQQKAKAMLADVERVVNGLEKTCKKDFLEMSETLSTAKENFAIPPEGVVYASDVRYLSCQLSEGYLSLSTLFSL